jgi:hypothetical protein
MNHIILLFAFRYALGKRSYAVDTVAREIHDNWKKMTKEQKQVFVREILERKQQSGNIGLGSSCHARVWMAIVSRFRAETEESSE